MGEVLDRTTEDRENTVVGRLRGMSDDMVGQIRNGTWEALAGPDETQYATWGEQEESPLIRKRKRGKLAGWRMES
jgi:hypothetical protein